MKKRMQPIMWCMQQESGYLCYSTLSFSKTETQQKLFSIMDDDFQAKYWKRWVPTLRAYRKMGYKAIRVRIEPKGAR